MKGNVIQAMFNSSLKYLRCHLIWEAQTEHNTVLHTLNMNEQQGHKQSQQTEEGVRMCGGRVRRRTEEEVEEAKTEMFLMEIRATVVDHALSHDLRPRRVKRAE